MLNIDDFNFHKIFVLDDDVRNELQTDDKIVKEIRTKHDNDESEEENNLLQITETFVVS